MITADQSSIAPAPVLTRQQDGKEAKEEIAEEAESISRADSRALGRCYNFPSEPTRSCDTASLAKLNKDPQPQQFIEHLPQEKAARTTNAKISKSISPPNRKARCFLGKGQQVTLDLGQDGLQNGWL